MPSCSASSISNSWAGISSRDSREMTVMSGAPARTALRATSEASVIGTAPGVFGLSLIESRLAS